MSETDIARQCRDAVRSLGIPCERVHSGQHRVKRGYMQLATKGTPDCWTALGWLEFKCPGKKLSEDQERWHAAAKRWGVRVAVVTSVEETIRIVRAWIRERQHEEKMGWL